MMPLQTLHKNTDIFQLLCSLEEYTLVKKKMLCEYTQAKAVLTQLIYMPL